MLKVKLLHEDAKLPTRADEGSNGYDLYSVEDVFIPIHTTAIIKTGISIELDKFLDVYPESNRVMPYFEIKDRSSMAAKSLRTGAGIVDFSYRGELKVVLHNLNNSDDYDAITENYGYIVRKGDRIAQGIISLSMVPEILEVTETTTTERNDKAFGSSGI